MDALAIFLGVVLGLVHYFSETIHINFPWFKEQMLSFAAGVSVSYLLVQFIPEVLSLDLHRSKLPFLYILGGFTIFHVIEKYIFQHSSKKTLMHRIKEVHVVALFIYHIFVGILLVYFSRTNPYSAVLLSLPLVFNLSVNNLSLHNLHHEAKRNPFVAWFTSCSTLFGVVFGILVSIPNYWIMIVASFIAGSLLFIVVRDAIPSGKKGYPELFIIGVISLLLLLYLTGGIY